MNRLVLPHPVSANRYWRHFRGMTVRSREAIAYRAEVQAQAISAGIGQPLTGPVHIEMAYHPRRPKKYTPGQPVRSLPQIFVQRDGADDYVGGYDALRHMLKSGSTRPQAAAY